MFRFANNEYLILTNLLPLLIVIFFIILYRKKKLLNRIGETSLIKQLMPEVSQTRYIIKFFLLFIALTFIMIVLSRPQYGTQLKKVKRQGVELMIALDVSRSMLAKDIKPDRLTRAKMAISKLVDKLQNDRIGFIVFAGDAYMQIPITIDYAAIKTFLPSINTNIAPSQGTDVASAIQLASRSFNPESELEKAMIIITDGENHQGDPVEAAKKAAEKGINIHTIGVGSPHGTPIPVEKKHGNQTFKKNEEGKVVISKLDETVLQEISAAGNGKYVKATNANLGLDKLFKEISKMEAKEMETKIYSDYKEQFQYFAAIALFFILLDFIILERKNRWLSKIDLFKPTRKFTTNNE